MLKKKGLHSQQQFWDFSVLQYWNHDTVRWAWPALEIIKSSPDQRFSTCFPPDMRWQTRALEAYDMVPPYAQHTSMDPHGLPYTCTHLLCRTVWNSQNISLTSVPSPPSQENRLERKRGKDIWIFSVPNNCYYLFSTGTIYQACSKPFAYANSPTTLWIRYYFVPILQMRELQHK